MSRFLGFHQFSVLKIPKLNAPSRKCAQLIRGNLGDWNVLKHLKYYTIREGICARKRKEDAEIKGRYGGLKLFKGPKVPSDVIDVRSVASRESNHRTLLTYYTTHVQCRFFLAPTYGTALSRHRSVCHHMA